MVAEKKAVEFADGKIFSRILLFVLPIVVTNLLQTFYNAADMMVVSLSDEPNAVGAVGVSGSFVSIILNLCLGFSVGANVVVARNVGAQNYKRAEKALHTALIVGFVFGLLGGGLGIAVARPVLSAMGTRDGLLNEAVKYTSWYFAGVPFLSLTNFLCSIFRAKGDSKTPLLVLSFAGLLNVLMNLFFVLVLGMASEGVAIATSLASVVSSVVLLIKLSKAQDGAAFSFKKLKVDKRAIRDIVQIGFPASFQSGLVAFSNVLIQSSIVAVNNILCPPDANYQPIVSGAAAGSNLSSFVYTAQNAVYQGAITFTSQNIGARKPERVYRVMGWCSLFVTVVGLMIGGSIFLSRETLLSLYGVVSGAEGSLEALEMQAATTQLLYVALPYFLCGLMEVGSGILRGLGKSSLAMIIYVIGTCVLRIVWLETVFPLFVTLEAIYICYGISWIVTSLTLYAIGFFEIKKAIRKKRAEDKIAQ